MKNWRWRLPEFIRLLFGGKTICPRCYKREFWIMFGGPGVCDACRLVFWG